jgi:hypothetical protein
MTAGVTYIDFDLDAYIETAVADATHALNFLKESGTLSASLIFNVSHRIPGHDNLLFLRFPQPWERDKTVIPSVLDVIRERLDKHPELAPPPGLLESNGGANFWGKGIVKTAELILLIEEAARFQAKP